jgi:class 3 adenylate cyclase
MLSGFYNLILTSLNRYPPDVTKSLGDGMLAVWEIESKDRHLAVGNTVAGLCRLALEYKEFRGRSEFIHGTPEAIGVGISLGLASRFPDLDDYAGRPVILAARLCATCPGDHVLVDRRISAPRTEPPATETTAELKSFGDYPVWQIGPLKAGSS